MRGSIVYNYLDIDYKASYNNSMRSKKVWNKKLVTIEAKKYNGRDAFRTGSGSAYRWAEEHGILDKISPRIRKIGIKWNLQKVIAEAKKYPTMNQLIINKKSAYDWAKRNNKLDHLRPLFIKYDKVHNTYDSAKKTALKYTYLQDFYKNEQSVYRYAKRENIIEEITSHMERTIFQPELDLQLKTFKLLTEKFPSLYIERESLIPRRDNNPGRVDLFIRNKDSNIFLIIELKSGTMQWNKKKIAAQLSKYKRAYRERKGFKGVFLFSDNGRYGQNIDQLETLINEKLY